MEREASLLRCSKLSCYVEFNRMVQAIARNGAERGLSTLPGFQSMQGTSAEYSFYTTLGMMLRQVVSVGLHCLPSNPSPTEQREELQQVYGWFHVNKPLITNKTKSGSHKPTLSLTTRMPLGQAVQDLDRPQTAPASLYQCRSSQPQLRPHTSPIKGSSNRGSTQPKRSFTSSYMSRSLTKDLDQVGVGRPFDRLHSIPGGITLEQEGDRVGNHGKPLSLHGQPARPGPSHSKPRMRARCLGSGKRGSGVGSSGSDSQSSSLNVVNIPNLGAFSTETERPSSVDFGTVFALAPSVAAQMTLNREMQKHRDGLLKQALLQPAHNRTFTAPQCRLRMNTPILSSEPAPTSQHRESSLGVPQGRVSSPQTEVGRNMEVITSEGVDDKGISRQENAQPKESDERVMLDPEVSVQVVKKSILPLAVGGSVGLGSTSSQRQTTSSQSKEGQNKLTASNEVEQSVVQSNSATESVSVETKGEPDKKADNDVNTGKLSLDNVQATKTTSNHLHRHKRLTTPMNTVCLSFTPAETVRRPRTSAGVQSKGSNVKVSMAAAGFNRSRYRPKTVHTAGSRTGIRLNLT